MADQNEKEGPQSHDKWRYTLYTVVIFIIVINPLTYMLVDKIFSFLASVSGLDRANLKIANSSGCPTLLGFIVHTLVFMLLVRAIMDFDL